jgi:MFS family permease
MKDDKLLIYIFAVDFLINVFAWYVFLFLLDSINQISTSLLYFAFFYVLRSLVPSITSFVLGYIADVRGVNRILKLALLTFLITSIPMTRLTVNQGLASLYIVALVFEATYTLYGVLKYSLVPKITDEFGRVNAVYELTYSILMVLGPPLGLFLIGVRSFTPLIPLTSLLVFSLVDKNVSYTIQRTKLRFEEALKGVFMSRGLVIAFCIYLSLAGVGALVNLAIVDVAQRIYTINTFIANFSLINALVGLGSLVASMTIVKRRVITPKLGLMSWLILSLYPLTISLLYFYSFAQASTWLFLSFSILNGFSNSIISIYLATEIQKIARDYVSTALSTLTILSNMLSSFLLLVEGMLDKFIIAIMMLSSTLLFINVFLLRKLNKATP